MRTPPGRPHLLNPRPGGFQPRFGPIISADSMIRLVLAFVLATALWLYVTSQHSPDLAFEYPSSIPVTAEFLPSWLTVRNLLRPIHVRVRLASGLTQIPSSSFVATVDLSGYGPGIHHGVPVKLIADPAVSVIDYSPHAEDVWIDRVAKRFVSVETQMNGQPPYGYSIDQSSLSVTPNNVRVRGPQTLVQEVTRAVISLGLGNARSSINASYPVVLENSQGAAILSHGLTVSPRVVRVRLDIKQLASYKTLAVVAGTITGHPAPGFFMNSLTVSPSTVTAYGSPQALNKLTSLRTSPVPLTGLHGGTWTQPANIHVPPGVYVAKRRVRVLVTLAPIVGSETVTATVRPSGLPANERLIAHPDSVLVALTGPVQALQRTSTKLTAYVSVAGLRLGVHTVRVHVTAPPGLRVQTISPAAVKVTIVQEAS